MDRREFLRAAGVALALPAMERFALAKAAEHARRMLAVCNNLGLLPEKFFPTQPGRDYALSPYLELLKEHRQDFTVFSGVMHPDVDGGHPADNCFLTAAPHPSNGGFRNTISLDQFAAQRIGDRTALPSIELGIDTPRTGIDTAGGGFARMYGSFISWRDPHTPVPKEIIPQLAFDRLFRSNRAPVVSGADPKHPSLVTALQRDDSSVLDLVMDSAKSVRKQGSASDRVRLDEYFDSIRSVEQRLEAALKPQKRWINQGKFPLDRPGPGIPETHAEHLRLMLDIFILAFWTDTTRIGTFMLGDAQSNVDYSFVPGVRGAWHSISHHGEEPERKDQYGKIINWQIEQLAYFLNRVKGLDEGGTSLLDNSMIMFGGSLSDGNRHTVSNLPLILAGKGKGTLRTGRRFRAPEKTPLCNLYVSMLHRMGLPEKSFGDSTGPLEGLS